MANSQQPPFRVLIVGGSVAGLTLAHCLERANIEYLVLEKGNDIAPQVGASIGIMPNGGRILEQLGLFDDIERVIEPLYQANIIYPDGYSFSNVYPKVVGDRFGYPIAFLDRQRFLQIVYERLRAKQNVLTGKRVVGVRPLDHGVAVVTTDGSVYEGDLVVGADGVHSRVRSMTVEYACVFGISSAIPGLEISEQINGIFDHLSVLTIHGRHGRIFWFVIQKLDKKYVYPDVPRFSDKDAERLLYRLKHVRFWKDICVGDLWKNREVFSMTALEEGFFETWHYERMVLAGDSVHKMTPNFGQGANCAFEDAATLSSLLHDLVNVRGVCKPSNAQIEHLLQQYRQTRYARMVGMCRTAASVSRVQARDGFLNTVFGRYWAPYAGNLPADMASKVIADAEVVSFLPLPERTGPGWKKYRRKRTTGGHVGWAVLFFALFVLGWCCIGLPQINFMFARW
ncbi:FAD-dependent oxidoreductase [Aspergillus ibericus CBS 121593]|uniref:FAD/NAD(P)-binding domain-containing protein n=1 Tax=Aspergillus ibericus CBS 121593 TaxID=1448316 RepID=A0A395GQU9_9EURO|nr:FAD/NAD(P)-binding domain-containing protein [Aspergillus ibericus CBS 121593]RAK97742.1 FAD/NAD(P)-binding domain-containing protein [Aspergillus ibericus CBS 121593]